MCLKKQNLVPYARANMGQEKERVLDHLSHPTAWHYLIPAIQAYNDIAGHGPTLAHLATYSAIL